MKAIYFSIESSCQTFNTTNHFVNWRWPWNKVLQTTLSYFFLVYFGGSFFSSPSNFLLCNISWHFFKVLTSFASNDLELGLQTSNEDFFHQNTKLLGLVRQILQIIFWAFSVFSADLSAPILVQWVPCRCFHYSTIISTKKTKPLYSLYTLFG